jgi:hypothetical protein
MRGIALFVAVVIAFLLRLRVAIGLRVSAGVDELARI